MARFGSKDRANLSWTRRSVTEGLGLKIDAQDVIHAHVVTFRQRGQLGQSQSPVLVLNVEE